MPYKCFKEGKRFVLRKYERKSGGKIMGTHGSQADCQRQMKALYAREPSNEADLRVAGRIGWDFMVEEFVVHVAGDECGEVGKSFVRKGERKNSGAKQFLLELFRS